MTFSDGEHINPEAFAGALESFDRQQVELTMIPLIQTLLKSQPRLSRCQLHQKTVHPVVYLIRRVVQRLLQCCYDCLEFPTNRTGEGSDTDGMDNESGTT